jgi:NAD(P)-dependent dehydrogenase (short-subunit alcohol dehydrogenase family)
MSKQQKVAIVTGASQGMGAALVKSYVDNGYMVVATARSVKKSDDERVIAVPGDIADPDVAQRVVASAVDRFGRVDTLINNAGIFISKPFTEYTIDDFKKVIDTNFWGFFYVTQFALQQMVAQRSGHIVQITTTLVNKAMAFLPAGIASLTKGGLDAVTRGLAVEYANRGIRVNAVAPSFIKTAIHPENTHEFLDKLHPLGRMGEVQDIVEAVMYLERATFVTGETLNVDGGLSAS